MHIVLFSTCNLILHFTFKSKNLNTTETWSNKLNINEYGLSRNIPEAVKREVRQRCGFGCVKCGNALYQYEHVIPVFANAKEHNPNHIVLLCGSCHDQVTRGFLSKNEVKKCASNPKCKQDGFSSSQFDIDSDIFKVTFGTLICKDVDSIINIYNESIFSIKKPEEKGAPFRISAFLADSNGNEILKIKNNEWFTSISNWDVKVTGSRITINKSSRDISLILRTEPPNNIIIEKLNMMHRGTKINCIENQGFSIETVTGTTYRTEGLITEISNQDFAVAVTADLITTSPGKMYWSGF